MSPEYLALVDPASFEPVHALTQDALMLIAARLGTVRLIDNASLSPAAPVRTHSATHRQEPAACSA